MIRFDLTEPPSANRLSRRSGTRIHSTTEYKAWRKDAGLSIMAQRRGDRIASYFRVMLSAAPSRKDIDNRIKPVLDALQDGGAIANDRLCRGLSIDIDDDRERGTIGVTLSPAMGPAGKPLRRKAA